MLENYSFLNGKTAIVTGAAGGIGEAICFGLAKYHINMLLVGRNANKLHVLAEKLNATGVQTVCLAGNLREMGFIDDMINTSVERFGGIDILVNNAGVAHHCVMEEMTVEQYNEIMETNVRAPYFLCRNALKYLRKSDCATIFNICSSASYIGYEKQSVYVASKHALLGMSKTLAAEVYTQGIRVHTISPGGVFTKMVSVTRPDLAGTSMIQPEDIANIVSFCLENRMSNAVIDEFRINRSTKMPFT
jgi:3-oxoacyl-[acyl-carrier protein] reductase